MLFVKYLPLKFSSSTYNTILPVHALIIKSVGNIYYAPCRRRCFKS